LEAALQLLRANGDRTTECSTLANLSALALWQCDETAALKLARSALDIAVAAQARDKEVIAGLMLGNAELALGRLAPARQAYARAKACALQIDSPRQHDAGAGLARVALAEGATTAAPGAMQPLLDHLSTGGTLEGTIYPRLIEFTGHQALARAGDPRASEWLVRAHTALMAQADAVTDATLRQGFLLNIPHHRDIVAAWAKRVAPGPSSAP
jgi:hypothetical protein